MTATRRSWWRSNRLALVLLVPALAAMWWTVGDALRDGWLADQPRVAVRPGAGGWTTAEETSVRVVGLTEVVGIDDALGGEPWQAPPGYAAWRLVLDVRSTATDAALCEVHLADHDGRLFGVPDRVPEMPEYVPTTFSCGLPGEGQGSRVETVFVVPSGVDPVEVRVTSDWTGGSALGPRVLVLPVP